jgi:acetyl esterase/lipase
MVRDMAPIHPELRDYWSKLPRLPYNRLTVKPIRWLTGHVPTPDIPDIEIDTTCIKGKGSGHEIKLRIYRPKKVSKPVPVLLWLHGGGLIIGDAKVGEAYVSRFVQELGIVVVSVNYRLAPDHPYPAAIDDCYTALEWVHAQAHSLHIHPDRIAVGGESAGGGLAATLAQLAYDRGEIKLVFQLLVYPMLDDRSALRTDLPYPELMIWTPKNNRFGWESYLQQPAGSDLLPPYAVPARREDLTGLPPAWVGVGTLDLFHEEDVAYAERLKQCGVDSEFVVVEGAFHGFDLVAGQTAPAQAFRESQISALRKYLLPGDCRT